MNDHPVILIGHSDTPGGRDALPFGMQLADLHPSGQVINAEVYDSLAAPGEALPWGVDRPAGEHDLSAARGV